jgi:hypothetical protein
LPYGLRLAACMSVSALALVRGIGISSGRLSAGYGVPLTALLPPRDCSMALRRLVFFDFAESGQLARLPRRVAV